MSGSSLRGGVGGPADRASATVALVEVQAVIVFSTFRSAFLPVTGPAKHLTLSEFCLAACFCPVPKLLRRSGAPAHSVWDYMVDLKMVPRSTLAAWAMLLHPCYSSSSSTKLAIVTVSAPCSALV